MTLPAAVDRSLLVLLRRLAPERPDRMELCDRVVSRPSPRPWREWADTKRELELRPDRVGRETERCVCVGAVRSDRRSSSSSSWLLSSSSSETLPSSEVEVVDRGGIVVLS